MKIAAAILILVLLNFMMARAQVPRVGDPEYTAQSRLLILRAVPGDKTVKLYFAGKKAGEVNLKTDHKVLRVTASPRAGAPKEELTFRGEGDFYEVTKAPSFRAPYFLSIETETKGQADQLEVHIQKNP